MRARGTGPVAVVAAGALVFGGAAGAHSRSGPPTISVHDVTVPATADYGETFSATINYDFAVSDPDYPSSQVSIQCTDPLGTTHLAGVSMDSCRAVDPAGNASLYASFTVTVTVPPPTFQNVPGPITAQATSQTAGAVVAFALPTAIDVGGRSVNVTCDHQGGVAFPVGTTTVTCSGAVKRDVTGDPGHVYSTGSAQFTVTVTPPGSSGGGSSGGGSSSGGSSSGGGSGGGGSSGAGSVPDTTAPTLAQHANVTVDATSSRGAAVSYAITATDPGNAAPQITVGCLPAVGSTFPLGTHAATKSTIVTCQAHDAAGNQAKPMSFTVTVLGVHGQIVALEREVATTASLPKNRTSSLAAQLTQADRAFRTGGSTAAGSRLGSFINQVGQLPHSVPRSTKSTWIASAARIIALLG